MGGLFSKDVGEKVEVAVTPKGTLIEKVDAAVVGPNGEKIKDVLAGKPIGQVRDRNEGQNLSETR